jgi:hypothetical protein
MTVVDRQLWAKVLYLHRLFVLKRYLHAAKRSAVAPCARWATGHCDDKLSIDNSRAASGLRAIPTEG